MQHGQSIEVGKGWPQSTSYAGPIRGAGAATIPQRTSQCRLGFRLSWPQKLVAIAVWRYCARYPIAANLCTYSPALSPRLFPLLPPVACVSGPLPTQNPRRTETSAPNPPQIDQSTSQIPTQPNPCDPHGHCRVLAPHSVRMALHRCYRPHCLTRVSRRYPPQHTVPYVNPPYMPPLTPKKPTPPVTA